MAKLWLEDKSCCVIILLFFYFTDVITIKDYYSYSIEDKYSDFNPYIDSFVPYKNVHQVQKRHTYPQTPENFENHSDFTDNRSSIHPGNLTNTVINTPNKNVSEEKIDNKKPLPSPADINFKSTNDTIIKKLRDNGVKTMRNLGENGTGIWWNITSSTSTPKSTTFTTTAVSTKTQVEISDSESKDDLILPDQNISYDKNFLNKHNLTSNKTDTHIYYNSNILVGENYAKEYWVDLTNRSDVKINPLLSNSHRRASTVKLSFDFPYYGHPVRNVTIATGGFLYTGVDLHSWLAATQYVAPLMANFDTSLHNDSYVMYIDNGTAFTVQWEKVFLQDDPKAGNFTFQTTLLNNGDIIFVYKDIPILVENIKDNAHPVKVGISDAYVQDRTLFMVRRKTIYEYHKVNFNKEDIKNWTVIYLTALPTCPMSNDCISCLSETLANFKCLWCPQMNKCSNGYDRNRQAWLNHECDKIRITNESGCHAGGGAADVYEELPHDREVPYVHASRSPTSSSSVSVGLSGIMTILFLVAFFGGLGIWVLYAYRNPHTTSGQILIRYRPSQWRWKRGEARYTAATIHM